jgi:hypothetical protein
MKKLLFTALLALGASTLFAQNHSMTGTIVSRVGPKLVVKMDSVNLTPTNKDSLDIYKDISGSDNPFGIQISSGWVGIAKLIYVSKTDSKYQFRIARETTSVTVNGVKKDQFVVGKKVKIEWKEK